jgi:hypothetical protein
MPLYKKNEVAPASPVIILLFGEPGVSKTSLSKTAKNPIILDFDRGHRRSYGLADHLAPSGWKEVLDELSIGTFDTYDTIVIDTSKAALDDFLLPYVESLDARLKTNKLKAFGAIGEQFKYFVNQLRLRGKDLIMIAHAKTEEDGDIKKRIPDVTGQSYALLLRIADQVGFVHMNTNNDRVVSFNPSSTTIGKNVANLPDLILPHYSKPEWEDYTEREIIGRVKESLSALSEAQRQAIETVAGYRTNIDGVTMSDADLKALNASWKDEPEHIRLQLRSYFGAHLKAKGWKYYADKTEFAPIVAVEPTPVVEAPPVEAEKEPDLFEAKEGE